MHNDGTLPFGPAVLLRVPADLRRKGRGGSLRDCGDTRVRKDFGTAATHAFETTLPRDLPRTFRNPTLPTKLALRLCFFVSGHFALVSCPEKSENHAQRTFDSSIEKKKTKMKTNECVTPFF